MEILSYKDGSQPVIPPHREWLSILAIDPRFRNRLMSINTLVRNEVSLHYEHLALQPTFINRRFLINTVALARPSLDSTVLEIHVVDPRFPRCKITWLVKKSFAAGFYDGAARFPQQFMLQRQAGLYPPRRFRCYIYNCFVSSQSEERLIDHFSTAHRGTDFEVGRVIPYLIGGPDDPYNVDLPSLMRMVAHQVPPTVRDIQLSPCVSTGFTSAISGKEASGDVRANAQSLPAKSAAELVESREQPSSFLPYNGEIVMGLNPDQTRSQEELERVQRQAGARVETQNMPPPRISAKALFQSQPLASSEETLAQARADNISLVPNPTTALRQSPILTQTPAENSSLAPTLPNPSPQNLNIASPCSSVVAESQSLTKEPLDKVLGASTQSSSRQGNRIAEVSNEYSDLNMQQPGPKVDDLDPQRWVFNDKRDALVAQYHANNVLDAEIPSDNVEHVCCCMRPLRDGDRNRMAECANGTDCLMLLYHPACLGTTESIVGLKDWFCPRCTNLNIGKLRIHPSEFINPQGSTTGIGSPQLPIHRPNVFRPQLDRTLVVRIDQDAPLSMSTPSPANIKPWTAELDKKFVNDPGNAMDFDLNTLDQVKASLRARQAHSNVADDPDYISIDSLQKKSTDGTEDPASPRKTTPKTTWTAEEDDALIKVIKECTEMGLFGEPMWTAAYPKMQALGFNRPIGGMKMRWCRGLRQVSKIDERRRKNEKNLLTALQVKKKGENGVGRGRSTIYGNLARAKKEQERKLQNTAVTGRDEDDREDGDDIDVGDEASTDSGESDDDAEMVEMQTPSKQKPNLRIAEREIVTLNPPCYTLNKVAKGAKKTPSTPMTTRTALLREQTEIQEAIKCSLEGKTALTTSSTIQVKTPAATTTSLTSSESAIFEVSLSATHVPSRAEATTNETHDDVLLSLAIETPNRKRKRASSVDLYTIKGMSFRGL